MSGILVLVVVLGILKKLSSLLLFSTIGKIGPVVLVFTLGGADFRLRVGTILSCGLGPSFFSSWAFIRSKSSIVDCCFLL